MLTLDFCLFSDYGYSREPDTTKCKKVKEDLPDLCLHGDVETLKDSMGYAYITLLCYLLTSLWFLYSLLTAVQAFLLGWISSSPTIPRRPSYPYYYRTLAFLSPHLPIIPALPSYPYYCPTHGHIGR